MKNEQLQDFSFTATMTNSKYVSQKKNLEIGLKIFRDYFNYGKVQDFLIKKEARL